MAAHRYWRAVNLEAYGAGELELSCFHLLAAGVRVDDTATLTSNIPPATGTLAALQDDDLTTAARWSAQAVKTLALTWDFGASPADITGLQLAGDSEARFALIVALQFLDDAAVWVAGSIASGITWPGAGTLTSEAVANLPAPSARYKYEETSGAVVTDSSGNGRDGAYIGGLLPAAPGLGGSARALTTTTTQYHTAPNSAWAGGAGFSVAFRIKSMTTDNLVILERGPSNNASIQTFVSSSGFLAGCITFAAGGASGGAGICFGSAISIADNNPRCVAVVIAPLLADCYVVIDGVDQTFRLSQRTMVADGSDWQIGSRSGAGGFGGTLDDLTFYPAALTLEQAIAATRPTPDLLQTNRIQGRAAPSLVLSLGTGPAIIYGIPKVSPPVYLGVESGSVKDLITGVLGRGIGRVRGTVKLKGTPDNTPLMRRVRLIRECDGLQVRETWSDPVTGIYDFQYIDELQTWTVVGCAYNHDKRAVIADGLTLANGGVRLMP